MTERDHMHIVHRFSFPTAYTFEPYGTQWHVIRADQTTICYMQMSKNESKPKWIRMGDVLEIALMDKLEDLTFIEQCIEKYNLSEIPKI